MIRYKPLIFMSVIVILTGCKNDACTELSATVEKAGYDEAEAEEPDEPSDMESADVVEVYEHFLNDELTAGRKEQQVYVDELFRDNDIEYCFLDIDGDGSEELQIRDHSAYYMVKVQEGALQVIFENWLGYEPILAGERCGILYYSHEYGSERIEFSKMSTDGSTESEGSLYWSDKNQNGNPDVGDSFYGSGDINMERYLRAREEYTMMLAENELEWTERRLKNFETWQEAYIDFIQKIHITEWADAGGFGYSLLYVSGYGAMGFYPCNVYRLEKGDFSEIGTGWYSDYTDENGNIYYDYFWEDSAVTEAEFEARINELIDTSKCVGPSLLYAEDEILKILMEQDENAIKTIFSGKKNQ